MSHQDPDRASPVPLVGRFPGAITVPAARKGSLLWVLLVGLAMLLVFLPAQAQPQTGPGSLQNMIDQAKPGDVLTPAPGTYAGPLVIDKPLTLDGRDFFPPVKNRNL